MAHRFTRGDWVQFEDRDLMRTRSGIVTRVQYNLRGEPMVGGGLIWVKAGKGSSHCCYEKDVKLVKQAVTRPMSHEPPVEPDHVGLIELPLSRHDAHVLLRALANANDSERTDDGDRQANTWIAQRLLRLVEDRP